MKRGSAGAGPRGAGPRRLAAVAALVVVAAAGAGGGWAYGYGYGPSGHREQAVAAVPSTTAIIRVGTITQSEEDGGTIGYAGYFTVYSGIAGTITWLPATGAVIRPGRRLFAVDGQDAMLLRGQTPAWRAFAPGMTDGADVAELQRNMIALGYDPYRAITVDGSYDWATQAAVERWQAHEGWPQNAEIQAGQVAFLPGALRVAGASVTLGATVASGTAILGATSTTPVVTVGLPAQEQATVAPGQRVAITLPDGAATSGRVLSIGSPAGTGTSGSSGAGSSSGSGSSGSGSSGSGGSGSGSGSSGPQASVGIVTSIAAPVTGLDGAPVQVAIATATQQDTLIVPIDALLAGPGGTYQVTVADGQTRRDVTVTLGLFDDLSGTVAIAGPGIADGMRVVVPAS
jgi:hypothetical protein